MQNQEQDVKTYAQMLKEGLEEVFSSEPYRRFLRFVANNPTYSYRNVLLILKQLPTATKVMGFKAWQGQCRCVRQGQHGLRIIAKFEKDEDEEQPAKKPKKKAWQRDRKFRRISVFDISQTESMDGADMPNLSGSGAAATDLSELFKPELLQGKVNNFALAVRILQEISPLPVHQANRLRSDGLLRETDILIQSGLSELHTIRTMVNQIVRAWRQDNCPDKELLAIEAESVAFIVCQYLGLDTSEFSFPHIARYSYGREQKALELFLDSIQKTAMYFIDSIEGILEAEKSGYDDSEFFLISQRRAQRFLQAGNPVYLVFPGQGELLTFDKKAIDRHEGPFATDRAIWFGSMGRAA